MAAIDSVYSNYLSTYGNKSANRYDTHRKSELRQLYNSIVKLNKESPIYELSKAGDVKRFAIDIKEHTHEIQNVVSSLTDSEDGIDQTFRKKIAVSSQPDIVDVTYIGKNDTDETGFELQILQTATSQMNLGKYLSSTARSISPGNYSFDLETASNSYEFQFAVDSSDTNLDIQQKIASLINNSNIGLNATIVPGDPKSNALKIESNQVGLAEGEDYQFCITHGDSVPSENAMVALGIDYVANPALNTEFLLNDTPCSSYSNVCTVNKTFELTFHGISDPAQPIHIGFKPDQDAIIDNVQELVDCYNGIITTAKDYATSESGSPQLLHTISNVAHRQQSTLDALGLLVQEDGAINIDRSLLTASITNEGKKELYSALTDFADALNEKATNVSLDPIRYANKLVVFYKNQIGRAHV